MSLKDVSQCVYHRIVRGNKPLYECLGLLDFQERSVFVELVNEVRLFVVVGSQRGEDDHILKRSDPLLGVGWDSSWS